MEEKLIEIENNNEILKILVRKKHIKSLRLKVSQNGKISLNIPYNYPYYKAVEFIKLKWGWIIKNKKRITNKKPQACEFLTNSKICIFGHERILNVVASKENMVDLDDVNLTIYSKVTDKEYVKKVFLKWAKGYCYGHLLDMFTIMYNSIFKKLKVRKPQLIIKPMKSMWGNCRYNKEIITLNLYLLKVPIECVNYVILHELAHMIYHDHGKEFKEFLTFYMPDWKTRKNLLNNYILEF